MVETRSSKRKHTADASDSDHDRPSQTRKQEASASSSSQVIIDSCTDTPPLLFTIGHGTRPLDELIELLRSAGVTKLVDVRSIPRSRTNPQFNRDALHDSHELRTHGIEYIWMGPELGGRRNSKQPDVAQHTAIRVTSFRNYAGYMCTSSFRQGLEVLEGLGKDNKTGKSGIVATMCSETLWWRCHRRMIADVLITRGWEVRHLGVQKEPPMHQMWDIARFGNNGELIYDGKQ